MYISLIIPVFNAELYLSECLDSIYEQITDEIEIIIVNDGSVDSSCFIIDKFLKKLSDDLKANVIYVEQENKGVSAARNLAIELASGDYIAFLDADDTLESNFFKKIIPQIKFYHPDIIQFNFNYLSCKKIKSGLILKDSIQENSFDFLLKIFNFNSWYPWARVYNKELFSNNLFPVGYTFEDPAVVPFLFIKAKNTLILSDCLYNYRENLSSITRSTEKHKIHKNLISLDYLLSIYCSQDNILFKVCFIHFFRIYLDYCFMNGGVNGLKDGWKKYGDHYFKISKNHKHLIKNKAGRLFIFIRYFSFFSYFIMKASSKIITFLKNSIR
ncbi:glycosyltransferase family 2 protein [Acinetobacter faecalis]|uniref:glycosyltransferase family 2 protein n=1 Tax=Acinetobacter faecalis TaxID=2665161 RepID=UPI002A90F20A|nr:glycosyltransferase [Acinetobacter faecalis]MDY6484736.1 glycosyltransferase [Acinetobacter faecalis]